MFNDIVLVCEVRVKNILWFVKLGGGLDEEGCSEWMS